MVGGRCQAKLGKGIEEREKGEKDLPPQVAGLPPRRTECKRATGCLRVAEVACIASRKGDLIIDNHWSLLPVVGRLLTDNR